MNSSEYKKYHESFMQNNHGSTDFHTFLCIFFTLQCTMICAIRQEKANSSKYVQEYLIIVLTLIVAHTVFYDYIYELNLAACLLLLYELIKNYYSLDIIKVMKSKNVFVNGRIHSITCLRGLTYLITALCILAVDFVDFPRHLAKTENYGYSLMDTGVGLFILISGIVHKNVTKNNYKAILKGNTKFILILLFLGMARYFTVKQLDYHEHVTEYGVHWNFFFTLAVCKLISSILLILTNNALLLSIFVICIHEFLLYSGLQNWVFSNQPRLTFIDANREGISSSLGYVALYLFAASLKQVYGNNTISRYCVLKKCFIKFVALNIITFITKMYTPASRTLANAGYCSFICLVLVTGVTFMYIVEIFFSIEETNINFKVPSILQAINDNGLLYFLICNLSTGIINLSFRTLLLPSIVTFIILNTYMIFTIGLTIYLNKKGIKL